MTDHASAARSEPNRGTVSDIDARRAVTAFDEQDFRRARDRLSEALAASVGGNNATEVASARIDLRAVAVKLRDAGYWRADKQGLRDTVALLWQADRFVSDLALHGDERPAAPMSSR